MAEESAESWGNGLETSLAAYAVLSSTLPMLVYQSPAFWPEEV